MYPPEVTEFVYITDDTYTKREVLRMEHLILKVLSFDLSTPTALAFLSHFCISNGYSKKIFHLASVSVSCIASTTRTPSARCCAWKVTNFQH